MKPTLLITLGLLLLASTAFGARQTLLDGETMLNVRTKINANFTELYSWGNHAGLYSPTNHGHDAYLGDAPSDGNQYVRQDGQWSISVGTGGAGTIIDGGNASTVSQTIIDGGGAQ